MKDSNPTPLDHLLGRAHAFKKETRGGDVEYISNDLADQMLDTLDRLVRIVEVQRETLSWYNSNIACSQAAKAIDKCNRIAEGKEEQS